MIALMDTSVLLWWITSNSKLSDAVTELISDPNSFLVFSAASGWEIAIKYRLGKLPLPEEPEILILEQIRRNGFGLLDVRLDHALAAAALPMYHTDPFDRMLIAQAILEEMPIISRDSMFSKYDVQVIW